MTIAVIMVNTDWAKDNRVALQGYVNAYLRGVREYCNAYHHGSTRKEMIDDPDPRRERSAIRELLYKYPWVARSPDCAINVASMLDITGTRE